MKLLEVQSSVRQENSISRSLSYEFVQAWQKNHSHAQHQKRDVGANPPAHPTELWTKANYTPPKARTSEMAGVLSHSEQLIEELL